MTQARHSSQTDLPPLTKAKVAGVSGNTQPLSFLGRLGDLANSNGLLSHYFDDTHSNCLSPNLISKMTLRKRVREALTTHGLAWNHISDGSIIRFQSYWIGNGQWTFSFRSVNQQAMWVVWQPYMGEQPATPTEPRWFKIIPLAVKPAASANGPFLLSLPHEHLCQTCSRCWSPHCPQEELHSKFPDAFQQTLLQL